MGGGEWSCPKGRRVGLGEAEDERYRKPRGWATAAWKDEADDR